MNYQQSFFNHEKNKCIKRLKYFLQVDFGDSCPPDFDGQFCWPTTSALDVAKIYCPLDKHANRFIFRWCSPNKTYIPSYAYPVNKWEDAHYSGCAISFKSRIGDIPYIFALSIDKEDDSWLEDSHVKFYFWDQVGSVCSILTLSTALIIFKIFSQLQDTRVKIHINLFIAILLQAVVSLTKIYFFGLRINDVLYNDLIHIPQKPSHFCRVLMTLSLYYEIVIFTWLLIESWHFFSFISLSPYRIQHVKRHVLVGWGFPILIILPWIIVQINSTDTNFCWVGMAFKMGILAVPVFVIVSINFCFFLLNVRIIFIKMRNIYMPQRQVYYWRWIKSSLMLVPLFGSCDILHIIWPLIQDRKIKLITLFTVRSMNSFQGLIVAVLYCFTNGQVHVVIERAWKNWKLKREINSKPSSTKVPSSSLSLITEPDLKNPDIHVHL